MTVKRYFSETAREALRRVKAELGPDAIVVSNRAIDGGVEIMAMSSDSLNALSQSAAIGGRGTYADLPKQHREAVSRIETANGHQLNPDEIETVAAQIQQFLESRKSGDTEVTKEDAVADIAAAFSSLAASPSESLAESDHLNRDRLTRALQVLLKRRTDDRAFAIGLFGHWGTGKSSLVRLLENELAVSRDAPEILVAEFNAWKNEKASNLAAVLAQTVLERLLVNVGVVERLKLAVALAAKRKRFVTRAVALDVDRWRKAVEWMFVLLPPAAALAAVTIVLWLLPPFPAEWAKPLLTAAAGVTAIVSSIVRFLRSNLTDWFKRLSEGNALSFISLPDYSGHRGLLIDIHRTLSHLCADCLHSKSAKDGRYLLLVIDDLDRCSVDAVKEILDAVRIVADIPRIVTLVAIDERIAYAAVEKHYDQFSDTGRSPSLVARDHLAKIFQVSITLPEAKDGDIGRYITSSLFCGVATCDAPSTTNPLNGPDLAPGPQPPTPESGSDGQTGASVPLTKPVDAPVVKEAFPGEIELFRLLASAYAFRNPRLVWRLHVSWRLLRALAARDAGKSKELEALMRLLFWREWRLQQERARWELLDAWASMSGPRKHRPKEITDLIQRALGDINQCSIGEWRTRLQAVDTVLLPASPALRSESE